MNPLVTIALPAHDPRRLVYLQEAVHSALSQTYTQIEVLISQDMTPHGIDPTIQAWCQELVSRDSRVCYRHNLKNRGLAGNWNELADAAKGEYLIMMGDDDRLLPACIERLVAANTSASPVVFSNHYLIDGKGKRLELESEATTKLYGRDVLAPGLQEETERIVWQNAVAIPAAIMRTADVRRLRFKENLNCPEIELYLRLAQEGNRFIFVPEYLSEYRIHPNTATGSGLWIEHLVPYLLALPAHPEVEPYRQRSLGQFLVMAVGRCLNLNEFKKAEDFIRNPCYPSWKISTIRTVFQRICVALPRSWGRLLHRAVSALNKRFIRPLSPRARYWIKVIGQYAFVQMVTQLLGALSGFFLLRALDSSEYAYFTLLSSVLGMVTILSDSGVSVSLTAKGGELWQNRERLSQLVRTGQRLQLRLALAALVVLSPVLFSMLRHHGASVIYALAIVASLWASVGFQLPCSVLSVVPRLYSQVKRLQHLDFWSAVVRLVFLFGFFFYYLNTLIASIITTLSIAIQYVLLKRWVWTDLDPKAPINREDQAHMVGIVKHLMPTAIFYCIQGQLAVWMISVFGNTRNIAEVGALSRLGVIYAIIGAVMGSIILPGFSRCQEPRELRRKYFQILSSFILFGVVIVAFSMLFPKACLWILGSRYSHLQHELVWMALSTALSAVVGAMWSLNSAKAWIEYCWIDIPLRLSFQLILFHFCSLSSVAGVLKFMMFSNLTPFLVNLWLTYRGYHAFKKMKLSLKQEDSYARV